MFVSRLTVRPLKPNYELDKVHYRDSDTERTKPKTILICALITHESAIPIGYSILTGGGHVSLK